MLLTDERYYSDIASALRYLNGTSKSYSPSQMAEAILDLPYETYNTAICDYLAMLSYSTTMMIGNSATYVRTGAFQSNPNIVVARYPRVSDVGSSAFQGCTGLRNAAFPRCKTIHGYAFYGCLRLVYARLDSVEDIEISAFHGCTALTSAILPNCMSIRGYAFNNCVRLYELSIPKCITIGSAAFSSCAMLRGLSAPAYNEMLGANAFTNCGSLSYAYLPSCTSIGAEAFRNCVALQSVSLPECRVVGVSAFQGCTSLSTVAFKNLISVSSGAFVNCSPSMMVDLARVNHVVGLSQDARQMFGSQGGLIRVPEVLYAQYMSDPYWSFVSSRIASVAT